MERLSAAEREANTAEGLARELTSAREAAKQQQLALEQERSKREGLARELASARAQAERVSAVEFNAHAANKMLQQERQKSEGLTRELATAREQQNSTEQARAERDNLARELASARQITNDQQAALAQARAQYDTLSRDFASARQRVERLAAAEGEVDAVKKLLTEQQKVTEQERQRAEGIARELASARDPARQQQSAGARGRRESPVRDRSALETRDQAPHEREQPAGVVLASNGKPTSHQQTAQERESSPRDAAERPRVQDRPAGIAQAPLTPRTRESAVRAVPVPSERTASIAGAQNSEPSASAKLIARAEQLLRAQDIGGARLLLERAAKSDNLRAVFLLAETYDPQVLADRKVIGVSGDRTKARELYLRASSGIPEAHARATRME